MIGGLVSGGQTGVDRAALDVALELGIPCGGWCPRCRKAEDGIIPERYPLVETPAKSYRQRTRWNIRDSDATLILAWGKPEGGTQLTVDECRRSGKPHLVIDMAGQADLTEAVGAAGRWIHETLPKGILNVAGPRASQHPGLYDRARRFLRALLGGEELGRGK
jgi:hypothetical protein